MTNNKRQILDASEHPPQYIRLFSHPKRYKIHSRGFKNRFTHF
jgi:hypothetical protein